jgi:hypothetical protein
MIYLRDEETGVRVEDDQYGDVLATTEKGHVYAFKPSEADALLRGLLRWKLETDAGETARERESNVDDWVGVLTSEWRHTKERSR